MKVVLTQGASIITLSYLHSDDVKLLVNVADENDLGVFINPSEQQVESLKNTQPLKDVFFYGGDGPEKIKAIKLIRNAMGTGLTEAKAFVERNQKQFVGSFSTTKAHEMVEELKSYGYHAYAELANS